jgi:hypothetical protein
MWIVVWSLALLVLASTHTRASPQWQWRDLTKQEIDDWYSPMEICMLELDDKAAMAPRAAQEECGKQGHRNPGHNKGCPIGKGSNKWPCYPPYKSRKSFTRGLEGFTDASAKPLLKMLRVLHERNMSIVFLGDSTMRQKINALDCELMREDNSAWTEGDLKGILPCHSSHKLHFQNVQVPMHAISIGPNSVNCLSGGMGKRDPEGGGTFENAREIIRKINEEEGRGVFVLANMGLWYNDQSAYSPAVAPLFRWLADVSDRTGAGAGAGTGAKDDPDGSKGGKEKGGGGGGGKYRNVVLWQETMAQHWPNEIGSGYYYRPSSERVEEIRAKDGVMHISVADWQVPGCCVHITNTSFGNDWRNEIANSELQRVQMGGGGTGGAGGAGGAAGDSTAAGKGKGIQLIPLAKITQPIADMHVCSPLYHYDCTHYCYWPLMWQPLWHDMSRVATELVRVGGSGAGRGLA